MVKRTNDEAPYHTVGPLVPFSFLGRNALSTVYSDAFRQVFWAPRTQTPSVKCTEHRVLRRLPSNILSTAYSDAFRQMFWAPRTQTPSVCVVRVKDLSFAPVQNWWTPSYPISWSSILTLYSSLCPISVASRLRMFDSACKIDLHVWYFNCLLTDNTDNIRLAVCV
jgi:hypothetical protein